MTLRSSVVFVLLISACTAPLKPVSFSEPVAVSSDLRVAVLLVSGAVRGARDTMLVPAGAILVPVATGPNPELQFNAQDQRTFVASFRSELERLKLVGTTTDATPGTRADLGIQLIFAQTLHNPNGHVYVLDVVMEIVGGAKPFMKQYRVVSSEGDSWWQRMNTDASEGKAKAATKLMRELVRDVAAYIEENLPRTAPRA
jgi:hypothetical protein